MRKIGFSTGALAKGDFALALKFLRGTSVGVIELSALRQNELWPLLDSLELLELAPFSYVSVHAPSRIEEGTEKKVVDALGTFAKRGWPVITHPDAIRDFDLWRSLGRLLCIENMDNRKPIGRTAIELRGIFEKLPEASFCLDLGHARQVDPTMTEALVMLREFKSRLIQLHVSEVNTASRHELLTLAAVYAFRKVASLIPESIPIILETPAARNQIEREIATAARALKEAPAHRMTVMH